MSSQDSKGESYVADFLADCRGFVTVDVLEKGLSRGAIAMG